MIVYVVFDILLIMFFGCSIEIVVEVLDWLVFVVLFFKFKSFEIGLFLVVVMVE